MQLIRPWQTCIPSDTIPIAVPATERGSDMLEIRRVRAVNRISTGIRSFLVNGLIRLLKQLI
jgi:hypothetical protein